MESIRSSYNAREGIGISLNGTLLGNHSGRVKRGDMAVAFEVYPIEREYVLNRIDTHNCNQAGIINFHALDPVVPDNLLPSCVNRWHIRKQTQQLFDAVNLTKRFLVR